MTIKFVDIGDPLLDGQPHGERDMWHYGFSDKFSQIGTYLDDVTHDVEWTASEGIVEIPLKTWYQVDKLVEWFNLLSDEQQTLIKNNHLLFSYAMEPYTDNFYKEIEKFADHLNKPYDTVAVASSNSYSDLQSITKLKVLNMPSGWMQWFSRRWIERDQQKFTAPELTWKPYVCLNARPRKQRCVMLGHLAQLGIINKGHVSFGAGTGSILGKLYQGPVDAKRYIDLCYMFKIPVFDSLTKQLPLEIDDQQFQFDWSKIAGIELITEGVVDDDISRRECGVCYAHFTLTEKVWRPIYYGMPFVLRSSAESIEYAKSIGYHMFDDLCFNSGRAIAEFIDDFCKWDRDSINNFRTGYRNHNRELFLHHSTTDVDNLAQQVKEWIN